MPRRSRKVAFARSPPRRRRYWSDPNFNAPSFATRIQRWWRRRRARMTATRPDRNRLEAMKRRKAHRVLSLYKRFVKLPWEIRRKIRPYRR